MNAINVTNNPVPDIVATLKTIRPYKIILFGSRAEGSGRVESDVDIIVVTNDDYMPENYSQKSQLYLRVANLLGGVMKEVPVDLIVYTKPMYFKFKELGSVFSKEIEKKELFCMKQISKEWLKTAGLMQLHEYVGDSASF